jgi:hypothetical protein
LAESLHAIAEHSDELSLALEALARASHRRLSVAYRSAGGTSRRRQRQLADGAPIAGIYLLCGNELRRFIASILDPKLLEAAHRYECRTARRCSVLTWIEERLRILGHPIGGPAPPLRGYERLSEDEILARIAVSPEEVLPEIYAFEWYHRRRQPILAACERTDPAACRRRVRETSPRPWERLPEPFEGYDDLRLSNAEARRQARERLLSCSREEIEAAMAYELHGRRREGMLSLLERVSALRWEGTPSGARGRESGNGSLSTRASPAPGRRGTSIPPPDGERRR